MAARTVLEQHIALFGESGSGKTVLVSSFYGSAQDDNSKASVPFRVIADDAGQGNRLLGNFLGMKRSATLPAPTQFTSTSYSFTIRLKEEGLDPKAAARRPFDALRLMWHDYPGEWFEQEPSGITEQTRRTETFRRLIESDVAFVLVDAQRLLEHPGEEERYLKALFSNFRNGLLALKDAVLTEDEPLVQFPRIWVVALSKADLMPDTDVAEFRDLVIEKAHEELNDLRRVIGGFVQDPGALSVGEDFLLLSSAQFTPGQIDVEHQIGVRTILPIAAMLPFQRHVRWKQAKELSRKVTDTLLDKGPTIAASLLGAALLASKVKLPGPLGALQLAAGAALSKGTMDEAIATAGAKLKELNTQALARHDMAAATMTGFALELEKAEAQQVLIRSPR